MNNIFKTKKTVFHVHLYETGEHKYKQLVFTIKTPFIRKPTIDVGVFVHTGIEYGVVGVEEYYDLNAQSLGFYNEMLKERLNLADKNDKNYYQFVNEKQKISTLFDIMSVLTNYNWYY